MTLPAGTAALLKAASTGYRGASIFAWQFARGKLKGDPAFAGILARGLLDGRARLLDLGCGQGLLASWLLAAQECHASGDRHAWPHAWPAPARFESYTGIELNAHEVERARVAFARYPHVNLSILQGDICQVPFPPSDAVVIMDVLHYLPFRAQEELLRRVRAALPPGGLLLVRIGDAAGGFGFKFSQLTDQVVALLRSGRWHPLQCRSAADWQTLLERLGFSTTAIPMSEGTPFTNTLFRAQAR